MTSPACLIVNRRSHRVRTSGSVLEEVARSTGAPLFEIENFTCLPEALARLADTHPALVFIEGGDGTVQAVLSGWPGVCRQDRAVPLFAVLPGGSTNLVWEVAGVKRPSVQSLSALLDSRADMPVHETTDLAALRLESPALPRPQIGFLLSTGALASAMAYTQASLFSQGRRGPGAIASAAIRLLAAPTRFRDEAGQPLLREYTLSAESASFSFSGGHALSLVTTLPRLSLGITPFWAEGYGSIAYTHAQWPVRGLRRAFLRILLGQTGPGMVRHGLVSCRTDALRLCYDGPAMLDGELLPDSCGSALKVSQTPPVRFLR